MKLNLAVLDPPQRALWARLGGHPSIRPFFLAGGTALAMQEGHRGSVDFDFFFVSKALALPDLREFQRAFLRTGKGGVTKQEPGTLHAVVSGVHVSFLATPYPLSKPLVKVGRASLAHPIDIGLMKLAAIVSRGERKDFIDLACVLERHLSLSDLLQRAGRRYADSRDFTAQAVRALVYFADADRGENPKRLVPELAWPKVRALIERETRAVMKKRLA